MRIPTAEFLAVFFATGQFSGPSMRAQFSLLDEPQCDATYTVQHNDNCDSIAKANSVPTYQIICENIPIDGQCKRLPFPGSICLGRKEEDCKETAPVHWPNETAETIAKEYGVPLDVFENNNYCFKDASGKVTCPPYHNEQTVCVAKTKIGTLPKCDKIFK